MTADPRTTAVVALAVSSTMLSIGVVVYLASRMRSAPASPEPPTPGSVLIDTTTPERAAESFLDAWCKRDRAAALRISRGSARRQVLGRAAAEAAMSPDERRLERDMWRATARSRLELVIHRSDMMPRGRMLIGGEAQGELHGRAYRRQVQIILSPTGDGHWVIEQMTLGKILEEEVR